MPFALNESTRFISPTKTPEFLAAGLPVVSTAIADVVRPYGALDLVGIANADDIADKLRIGLASKSNATWLKKVDEFLAGQDSRIRPPDTGTPNAKIFGSDCL